jgi:DNA-binding transcriptional LysR family regulator
MSHALGRLRDLLGDPILVRSGRGMVPTPRAEALQAPLASALRAVQAVLRAEPAFEPANTTRRFVLACPDLVAPVLPALLAAIRGAAPGVDLAVVRPEEGAHATFERHNADAALGPERDPGAGVEVAFLGAAPWATLCRPDHPVARQRDLPTWIAHGHVQIGTGGGEGLVDALLRQRDLARRVALTLPSFLLAPRAVAVTDLLYTGPEPFLHPLATELGLVVVPPPLPLPPAPVVLAWPARLTADPGGVWFRARIAETVRGFLGVPSR